MLQECHKNLELFLIKIGLHRNSFHILRKIIISQSNLFFLENNLGTNLKFQFMALICRINA